MRCPVLAGCTTSVTGALTWNANGTLQKLVITDPFNSADNQTCPYQYDNLAKIYQVDCGTGNWGQQFTYDPFGNLTKTVLSGHSGNSFQPSYSLSTNRMTSLPGFSPTYDNNGNVTNDNSHQYAWDADGNSITIDGVGLTYDALDRMVEQNRSGSYTQIVYAPTGDKLALMNGQTLQKAFVSLPGQATAVYTSSGLDHYRHSDWLGSARFASTPSRAMYSDVAYAPFGETYAQAGTADPSFTEENQDTVAGDYDFLAREYSTQGRWPSPDPAGLSADDPSNPQSWDQYAYVLNDPLDLIDPLGLCPPFDDLTSDCVFTSNPPRPGLCPAQYQSCVSPSPGVYIAMTSSNSGYLFLPFVGDSESEFGFIWMGAPFFFNPNFYPGGGPSGGPGGAIADTCRAQAQAAVNAELRTFAGYAGAHLIGKAAVGAFAGAVRTAGRFSRTGNPWVVVTGAAVGAATGAAFSMYSDSRNIQRIQNSFMSKFMGCVQKNLIPKPPG